MHRLSTLRVPTKDMMKEPITIYQRHEFFPTRYVALLWLFSLKEPIKPLVDLCVCVCVFICILEWWKIWGGRDECQVWHFLSSLKLLQTKYSSTFPKQVCLLIKWHKMSWGVLCASYKENQPFSYWIFTVYSVWSGGCEWNSISWP